MRLEQARFSGHNRFVLGFFTTKVPLKKACNAVNGANADKWELGLDSLCCNDANKANIAKSLHHYLLTLPRPMVILTGCV